MNMVYKFGDGCHSEGQQVGVRVAMRVISSSNNEIR